MLINIATATFSIALFIDLLREGSDFNNIAINRVICGNQLNKIM